MTGDVWSALIGLAGVLIVAGGRAGYVLWTSRTQRARAAVKETVTAQDVALAALKAELKAARLIIRQQADTIQYLRDRLTETERR